MRNRVRDAVVLSEENNSYSCDIDLLIISFRCPINGIV